MVKKLTQPVNREYIWLFGLCDLLFCNIIGYNFLLSCDIIGTDYLCSRKRRTQDVVV